MLPEAALPTSPHPARGAAQLPDGWRRPLILLGAAFAGLLAAFFGDWAAMADQWWNSSTYTHVLLVPPIIGWLVWQRRGELARLVPSGWWPGLVLFAGALLLWVLGAFAGLNVARQLGVVAMGCGAVLALLGPRLGRALAFPLLYAFFMVPIGDELVPKLQLITAEITIALVHLSHFPATIDGVFINTPAGLFEVAEACSGVKFLVAMIAFGVLTCHLCFKSWTRRAAFMVLAVVAPVLANGVRAWGTIYVAQFKGAEYATGFDHIVYGWIFFALVIALVVLMSWRFFDRSAADPLVDVAAIERSALLDRLAGLRIGGTAALAAMALAVLGGGAWAYAADRLSAPLPKQVFLPEVPGWQRASYAPSVWWEPRASGADHRLLGRYVDGRGHEVDVFFALYSGQSEGREAGGFGEGALTPDGDWSWLAPGPALPDAQAVRLLAQGRVERVAETRYRTGELLTGSNARLKLANIADRLFLRERPTMMLILSAEKRGDAVPEQALSDFRAAAGPIGPWMDRIGGVR